MPLNVRISLANCLSLRSIVAFFFDAASDLKPPSEVTYESLSCCLGASDTLDSCEPRPLPGPNICEHSSSYARVNVFGRKPFASRSKAQTSDFRRTISPRSRSASPAAALLGS